LPEREPQSFSPNSERCSALCLVARLGGKPLHTFPNALAFFAWSRVWAENRFTLFRTRFDQNV